MKRTICLLTILSLLPLGVLAQATTAGNPITYDIGRCEQLEVSIEPCEPDEWMVDDCNETETGFFSCTCSDNFQVSLTPATNSVGIFDIEIISYYMEEGGEVVEEVSFEYRSHLKTKPVYLNVSRTITKNATETVTKLVYVNESWENTTAIEELNNTVTDQEVEIKRLKVMSKWRLLALIMVVIVIIGTVLYFSIRNIGKPHKKEALIPNKTTI